MSAHRKLDRSVDDTDSASAERQAGLELGERRTSVFGVIFQESLDTLILGALSTSLGVVLILVPLLDAMQSSVWIDLPLTTYLALVPIGTSLGVIGIVRARMMNRFTSPLSTLGALLCFLPASPLILESAGNLHPDHGAVRDCLLRLGFDRETRPDGGLKKGIGRR